MSRRVVGIAAVLMGTAMSALMQTMLATAAPRITAELGRQELYSWVFASYLVGSTVTVPPCAAWADRRGRRPVFVVGVLAYLAGTAACALAGSMGVLVAARGLQGAGAGALAPASLAALGDLVDERSRGRLFGAFGVVQVIATSVGPALGGVLTDGPGWRWALWSVLPVGVAVLALGILGMPERPEAAVPDDAGWGVLAQARRRTQRPLALEAAVIGAVTFGFSAYLPLLSQAVLGTSATESAGALTPLLVGFAVGSALSGRLARRAYAAWGAVAAGALVVAFGAGGGVLGLGAGALLTGLGLGTLLPVLLIRAQDAAGRAHAAAASGLVQLSRNAGGALATPVLGLLVTLLGYTQGLVAVFLALAVLAVTILVMRWLNRPARRG